MDTPICTAEGCQSLATTHYAYVQNRRLVEQRAFCEAHGRDKVAPYWPTGGKLDITLVSRANVRGVPFDVEVLYSEEPRDYRQSRCEIYLRQIDGLYRLPIQTGLCELAALSRSLDGVRRPRPLTHETTNAIMSRLGGKLDFLMLNEFIPEEYAFEATLYVLHNDNMLTIPVRASDGITLAMISDAPILVAPQVLTSFGQQPKPN